MHASAIARPRFDPPTTGHSSPIRGGGSENDGYQIGGFGEYTLANGLTAFAYAGFGETDLSLRRVAGSSSLSASTSASVQSYGAAVSTVFELGALGFAPRASIDSVTVDVDGYTERGGPAALIVPDRSATTTLARVSGSVFGAFSPEGSGWTLYPRATVGYVNAIEFDTDAVTGAQFVAAPGSLIGRLPGDKPDNAWFDLDLGVDVALSDRATWSLGYQTSLDRDDADLASAQVGLRVAW